MITPFEAVQFPQTRSIVVNHIQNSPYLEALTLRKKEQVMKHGTFMSSVSELVDYYADSTVPCTTEIQSYVCETVKLLLKRYPKLPQYPRDRDAPVVSYVVLKNPSPLEFGKTSFTISNVVFLHSSATNSAETVMHEYIHVVQRLCPSWFHSVCTLLGYSLSESKPPNQGDTCFVLNPDARMKYQSPTGDLVAYTNNMSAVLVDKEGMCQPISGEKSSKVKFLGVSLPTNSVFELFCVRLTAPRLFSDPALVKKVNNLLEQAAVY